MSIEIRALRPDELDVHDQLIFDAYREYSRDGQDRRWWLDVASHDPYYSPDQTQVMFADGVMVASVTAYWREMYCAGTTARVGAIGSVATHPDHRKRGYVRTLLQASCEWMRENQFDFSFLFGREEVYGGSGWCMFSAFGSSVAAHLPAEAPGEVRQAQFPADIPALQAVYDSFNASLTGTFLRSTDYWARRVTCGYFRDNTRSFFLVEKGGEPVGYFRSDGEASVTELGWRREVGGAGPVTVGTILCQWPDREVRFGCWNPDLQAALAPYLWAPSQAAMREKSSAIHLSESNKGLWKYIGPGRGAFPQVSDTESLIAFLHAHDYTFWSGVDNF